MAQSRVRIAAQTIVGLFGDLARFLSATVRSHAQLSAENLFLRKQLALYVERQVKPRRADDATRIALVALSWLIDWRRVLTIVKPATLIRWHRKGFRLFWRWKITAARTASITGRRAPVDRGDGGSESHLGRRADRVRTPCEAGDSCVASDGAPLHADRLRT